MAKLLAQEINYLGYWDRFCAIRGFDPAEAKGATDPSQRFDVTDDEMDMLRGIKPMPVKAEEEKEKLLPVWAYIGITSSCEGPNDTVIAKSIRSDAEGELLADAPRMLEALRLLSKESLGDWVYEIRDKVIESDFENTWDHPRVVSWGRACELTAELVKKHAGFGK